jgi:hypothetical protein
VVTHLTTNPPVRCLNRAERTGSLVFNVLWSNVEELDMYIFHIALQIWLHVPDWYGDKCKNDFRTCVHRIKFVSEILLYEYTTSMGHLDFDLAFPHPPSCAGSRQTILQTCRRCWYVSTWQCMPL